ncbi:hypothetical protein [Amycolatopsis sp. PS_44_ISF1]|uniref:hypothetical protein n=1 Tax=Amycolatopsis sp. PS_44_ISF1 TaxID=2974917 RepID=UPI0028DF5FEB|nr:hypothetical protein [Amycolatopsis sp. PS_44_ISF1]MDT8916140.1 hypothetical protein [Amycolatopsis sp. PS_44_ISF1]
MGDANAGPTGPAGRWVSVRLQHRHVRVHETDEADDRLSLSYPGIAISNYDEGHLVGERWIPLGADPSEQDDELLIEQLRAAMLWQDRPPPRAAPSREKSGE